LKGDRDERKKGGDDGAGNSLKRDMIGRRVSQEKRYKRPRKPHSWLRGTVGENIALEIGRQAPKESQNHKGGERIEERKEGKRAHR
jgi:hypothetical protein